MDGDGERPTEEKGLGRLIVDLGVVAVLAGVPAVALLATAALDAGTPGTLYGVEVPDKQDEAEGRIRHSKSKIELMKPL